MVDVSRGGAVWSARMAHNHQVAGSNPAPATKKKRQPFGRRFFFAWQDSNLRLFSLLLPFPFFL